MVAVLVAAALAASHAPAACSGSAAQAVIRTFVADINAGRPDAAARLWAPEPYFQWYSAAGAGRRVGSKAYNRATLAAYFVARARAHERLTIVRLGAGYDPRRDIVNFAGMLVRRGDDITAAAPHPFKGAAACRPGGPLLIVWSM